MKDLVLISTHDLPRSGEVRDAFKRAGYGTDLVTPAETIPADSEAQLLVVTGGVGQDDRLARQAHLRGIPVYGLVAAEDASRVSPAGYDEIFSRDTLPDDIVLLGGRLIQRKRLQRLTGIVGETDAMKEALERVVQIAPVQATVLVTGESGTGKELVARGIHALSPRRHRPFIAVNVAALSETLLESELFGHEKGAFTGAIDARRGLFEVADHGTIFLDEIGEMPLTTQTKLLRVLEQREFMRVGGEKPIHVDVRIVAATNQDLRRLVEIGDFRRDLYFRLNVLHIELPPLRERRDDIPLLVEAFIREASERHGRAFPGVNAEAMELLRNYSWPGNVRELRNLVESMVVLAPRRVIRPEDIPLEMRQGGAGRSLLPAPIFKGAGTALQERALRPELEFIFRTLVELRVDMEDLRREFDLYRRRQAIPVVLESAAPGTHAHEAATEAFEVAELGVVGKPGAEGVAGRGVDTTPGPGGTEAGGAPWNARPLPGRVPVGTAGEEGGALEPDAVIFRPGMTMDELERRAIESALAAVGGNRRKAAEMLGIGERTLYRKIKKFGLDE